MSQNIQFNSFKELNRVKDKISTNKKKKEKSQQSFDDAWKLIHKLKTLYPKAFNYDAPLPLAIGVSKEIQKQYPDFPLPKLRFALAIWTRRKQYLHATVSNNNRHNLDGSIAGDIQESEKEYSRNVLKNKYQITLSPISA